MMNIELSRNTIEAIKSRMAEGIKRFPDLQLF